MKTFTGIIILFLAGCNASKMSLQKQRKDWGYKTWPKQYKERALCKCLVEGYNDKALSAQIKHADASFYNIPAMAFFDSSINILVKKEADIIIKDSAANVGRVGEAAQGKTVFNHCMAFYKSATLDSAMKMEREKWKKIKNIEGLISERIPAW